MLFKLFGFVANLILVNWCNEQLENVTTMKREKIEQTYRKNETLISQMKNYFMSLTIFFVFFSSIFIANTCHIQYEIANEWETKIKIECEVNHRKKNTHHTFFGLLE